MSREEIENFSIDHLQILDQEGNIDSELDPDLRDDKLFKLYRAMLFGREADQRSLKLQRQGRIGTVGPGTGQEALSCGAALAMDEKDWFVPTFREMPGMFMRGWSPAKYYLWAAGYEEGNRLPENSRTLPIAIVVGTQLLHATGLAYAAQHKGEKDTAVVTFVGDGGTSEGDFHEALNFAAVWNLPVVFIIQNNQWAISVPVEKQTNSKTLAQKAIAYGMEGIKIDGNDPLAVYKSVNDSLEKAKNGGGPTLIEGETYRLMMHTTADDPTKYRDEEEVEKWWDKEPLKRFRKHLKQKGIVDENELEELEEEIEQEIKEEVKKFENMELDEPEENFKHTYGTTHEVIEHQKELFQNNNRKKEEDND